MQKIKITETVLRDGHQSLIATRMNTEEISIPFSGERKLGRPSLLLSRAVKERTGAPAIYSPQTLCLPHPSPRVRWLSVTILGISAGGTEPRLQDRK